MKPLDPSIVSRATRGTETNRKLLTKNQQKQLLSWLRQSNNGCVCMVSVGMASDALLITMICKDFDKEPTT